MGLFDIFKNTKVRQDTNVKNNIAETVNGTEKRYYQEDEYYQVTTHEGTIFENTVVRFEDRKANSYPSKNGLYVAEILLLHYCNLGKYPHPSNGYPGFWWFKYGIRDVTAMLRQLENRNYICFGPIENSLKSLKVNELKGLLSEKNISQAGKKAELMQRVAENFTEEELRAKGIEPKYILTDKGKQELCDNEYIPFMHSFHYTTIEGIGSRELTIWTINKLLHETGTENWKDVVISEYNRINNGSEVLDQIFRADAEYQVKGDRGKYIMFWEALWAKGKLEIDIQHWIYMLPKLYVEESKLDEVLSLIKRIDELYGYAFEDESNRFVNQIEKKKAKDNK